MNATRQNTAKRVPTGWALGVLCCALALTVACGESTSPPPPPPGSGGSGGTAGSGGAGAGGVAGSGGMGGDAGNGGVAGLGGNAGSGGGAGSGGMGGVMGACATNALCHTCPDRFPCDTDDDCTFSGYSCIPSGCETHGGAPIKHCQPARGGACVDETECPNVSDYDCINVGAGGKRCVRVSPGCDPVNEAYDCVPGFSCEGGSCVDRRVPCDSYLDCPRSHVCNMTPTADFCVRVFRSCHRDEDCADFGSRCADVDGDGRDECVGAYEDSGVACVNAVNCGSGLVCETGATAGAPAVCGDYGLCRDDGDCGGGFNCVELWQDERSECVPNNGSCATSTVCPVQQVCAAPRNGNPPSCQAGTAP